MRNQSKSSAGQTPQATGRNPFKAKNRPGKNGNSKASADGSQVGGLGLHLLAKELRTIRLFETMAITDATCDKDIYKMVDTEEKQLQAIEDLYAILRAQPKYKNLKEPDFKATDSPMDVLCWILKKLGPLAKGNQWTTDIYKQGNKVRFRFVVYKYFHSQKVNNQEQFIPFDFLPVLKKRDLPLHNLIIELVAMVSRVNKIPLWDEDGDFSEPLKYLKSMRTSGNDTLDAQMHSYKTGVAAVYLKIFKERRKVATRESLYDLFQAVNFKSQRKSEIHRWLLDGLHLINDGSEIIDHSFVPNYNIGNPLTPYRQFKFIWSLHKSDYLRVKAFDKQRKDESDGLYIPMMFTITKPGEVVREPGYKWYPEGLFEFMKYGHALFCGRYRQYFYKNQFEQTKTPSESLINIIELAEIQSGFIQPQISITV